MGAYFDNLHVLKNDSYDSERLKIELCNILKSRGFSLLPEGSEGDVSLKIFEPNDTPWVSIAADAFVFDSEQSIRSYTDPLSASFNTDIIAASCYDSDYLRLALLNSVDSTDGWINVGKSYDPLVRRTKLSPWKKLVENAEELKAAIKKDYVYAEEAFTEIAPMIGMRPEQATFGCFVQELSNGKTTKMIFSAPEEEIKPPKLKLHSYNAPPCNTGHIISVSFINSGDKAKGLGFLFTGACIDNDEITVKDVSVFYDDKITRIQLQKSILEDGKKCLYWEDPNFQIPPAVNENLPIVKKINLEFDREIALYFTLAGDPKNIESLRLVGYPLSNFTEGQVSWYNRDEYC